MGAVGWIIIGVIALLVIMLIFTYNRLVRLRNRIEAAWAQIDVQLKRLTAGTGVDRRDAVNLEVRRRAWLPDSRRAEDSWRQRREASEVTIGDRKVLHGLGGNRGRAFAGRRLNQRRFASHGDGFRERADFDREGADGDAVARADGD